MRWERAPQILLPYLESRIRVVEQTARNEVEVGFRRVSDAAAVGTVTFQSEPAETHERQAYNQWQ